MAATDVLTLENPSFCAYIVCCCILVLKMVFTGMLTGYKRSVHKVFSSQEDADFNKGQVIQNDDVERVRRAHLNDLENIPIFWISAFVYLWTKPPTGLSCFLFFTFTIVRIAHTVIYAVYVVRQPARSICYLVGLVLVIYMSVHSMIVGFAHI